MINPIGTLNTALIANENKKSSENIKPQEAKEITDKIAQIRELIKNDAYEVNLKKTSEKMALNLLNL
ncbi:flagellar biosynthesis anti-sigma factor FlgM [Helicobacter sp. 11S02596-1]|uniref:flagellar biosynthesis anti-sigma factor FlgM n=1 Tax=Helicobacter sp. 11S02596-1 TaxID=1476194 RepID=UPI000BA5B9CA|nr:flagellar biosynthesis anti-sigma factor FlgM [Helicobacter sp. 11S02596-1]PAF44300.1 hypothetical protein BJI48_03740 [Helicobacter sp. 11S02596-1]